MGDIIPMNENAGELTTESNQALVQIADNIVFDAQANIANNSSIMLPIAELATLGGAVSSLLPTFRTITQTTSTNVSGLYRWVNPAGAGDALKLAKDRTYWGASIGDKMAKFKKIESVAETTTTTVPFDPAILMIAAALFAIEKQLSNIAETQKNILSLMEIEQESKIEGDVQTLSSIIAQYKHNWNNELYVCSHHQMACDIQRSARESLNAFPKQLQEIIGSKPLIVGKNKVESTLNDLVKKFKYYRLSVFTFSMASLLEVMLSENYDEANICAKRNEVETISYQYREIFSQCSAFLEELSESVIEASVMKGVGTASKVLGKLIGNIPKIKDGQIDEILQGSGEFIQTKAEKMEKSSVTSFAELSNPGSAVFIEKMNDLIRIYNHTAEVCFDANNIYLITA